MPIIETVNSNETLSQGDILSGVKLFATDANGEHSAESKHQMCLVLTRPCGIAHKSFLTVAAVDEYKFSLASKVQSFSELLAVMSVMRDGHQSPDVFYLGSIPGLRGRFCARLEQLHCVNLPLGEDRDRFVSHHRIGRLHIDFCRDLHLRLFRAYASLGFDDHGWLSTDDLKSLMQFADNDLAQAKAKVEELRVQRTRQELVQQQFSEKPLTAAEEAYRKLAERVRPYREELERREDKDRT